MNIRYFFIPLCIFTLYSSFTSCSSLDRGLHRAIMNRYKEEVRLVQSQQCINRRTGSDQRTVLFNTCAYGCDALVRLLISRGADMNIPDKDGMTPLIGVLSSSMRPGLIAKILIEHGADVNAHNPQGLTALHMATNGRFTCVKSLLEHGANPNDTTQGGATPLYLACCEGCLPIVDILLRYNANKNIACNDGSTPLQMARRKGNPAIIRLLTTGQREMPQYDTQGRTALSRACKEGKIDEIQKLIAQGANVNAANEDINETPLMLACHESRADIIRLLVKNGADVNLAGRDFSPLMVACRYATPEIVDFLIEEGADPHWESSDRHANALHWACMQGDLYTIRRFVEDFHISVTTKTRCIKSGNVVNKTPLEIAQDFNHQDVVDFLSGIVRILTFTAQCLHNS